MKPSKILLFVTTLTLLTGISTGCALENADSSAYATAAATEPAATTVTSSSAQTTTALPEPLAPDDVIPAAVQSPRIEGSRLSYSIMNVYSGGDY